MSFILYYKSLAILESIGKFQEMWKIVTIFQKIFFLIFTEITQNLNQLCRRFTKFVTMYDLMPKDNLIVPVRVPKTWGFYMLRVIPKASGTFFAKKKNKLAPEWPIKLKSGMFLEPYQWIPSNRVYRQLVILT